MVAAALLSTKLRFPQARSHLIPRPRLIERLQTGLAGPLTLISAPAGYGKTTLLCEWRQTSANGTPAAWLTLDSGDNSPLRFLHYLAAAIETLRPGVMASTLELLASPQTPPVDAVTSSLVNEVGACERDFIVAIDECHHVTSPAVYEALNFIILNMPPNMHLVMLTRADPPLPLARLRVGGQLVEIRAGQLRFNRQETAAFLAEVMGVELSENDLAALEARSEGWIAALQLAALSMQGRSLTEKESFITAFSGTHRYIVDYLAEQVLTNQDAKVKDFLLATSILTCLCGPLCDAVAEIAGSQQMLENLENANLFVAPLDDSRTWYRYHPLFAEFLRNRLRTMGMEQYEQLNLKAAHWLEQQDSLDEAVPYALAAHDFEYAVSLIERQSWSMVTRDNVLPMLEWVKALPPEVVHRHLRLCFNYAQALIEIGQLDQYEPFLQVVEQAIENEGAADGESTLKSLEENLDPHLVKAAGGIPNRQRLPFIIDLVRGSVTRLYDIDKAQLYCDRAMQRIPPEDLLDIGPALNLQANLHLLRGEMEPAEEKAIEAAKVCYKIEHFSAYEGAVSLLGFIHFLRGKMRQAQTELEKIIHFLRNQPQPIDEYGPLLRLALVCWELNDLDDAAEYHSQVKSRFNRPFDFTFNRELLAMQARLEFSRGHYEAAVALLDSAERMARGVETRQGIFPVRAQRARVFIASQVLAAADKWAAGENLSLNTELTFYQEYNLLTLARLWTAQSRPAEALKLLDRLLPYTTAARREIRVADIHIQRALAYQSLGIESQALTALSAALAMAQTEGWMRIFLDEGTAVLKLLEGAARQRITPAFTNRLLQAALPQSSEVVLHPSLIEQLSDRELEVLRLVAEGRSNQEIAERLVLAVGTVKKHISNIFGKLSVDSRTQCVARARQLGLVE